MGSIKDRNGMDPTSTDDIEMARVKSLNLV